jgi:hypothetical protein
MRKRVQQSVHCNLFRPTKEKFSNNIVVDIIGTFAHFQVLYLTQTS